MWLVFCNKTTKYLCTSKFSWPKSKTQSVQFQKKERREKGRTEVFWFNLAKLYPNRSYKVWESLCLWYPPTGQVCRLEKGAGLKENGTRRGNWEQAATVHLHILTASSSLKVKENRRLQRNKTAVTKEHLSLRIKVPRVGHLGVFLFPWVHKTLELNRNSNFQRAEAACCKKNARSRAKHRACPPVPLRVGSEET